MKVFNLTGVKYIEDMNPADPSWLISACIDGNEDAIESLVRQYETDVFRLALSICNNATEAHEVTQETFIAALKALRTYQEQKSFKAWLCTIAINTARSHLRKRRLTEKLRRTLTTLFTVDAQQISSPEEIAIQNEAEAALWKTLDELDERHRIVTILRYFHELSVNEIAEILSLREGTIHSRLHTARERLKDALDALNNSE